ncbi:MAG TPA: M56 family metallopeptidase [Flavitalea sp.]|nr:M56 family metallopeptidase [Flavitalea sp.]
MNVLYHSAFLKALGWSLLDSFWQMGVLWLVYVLLTQNGKKFKSGEKHSLALLSLAGGALWFVVTLMFHFHELVDEAGLAVTVAGSETNSSITSFFSFVEPVLPFLSLAYLLSVVYLFIRLYRQYYVTQKLFTTAIYKVNPELRVFLKHMAAQMGLKKDVRIWLSNLVDTPLTIGFWKPVILLPVAVVNQLSLQQAEAVILHELNHIRRNDYFINLLIACMDILLFFNPFVRILTHIIKNERENSCDDMVLQFRYDAGQYANALLLLEKNRMLTSAVTINATGRSKKLLLKRVERILNKTSSRNTLNQKLVAYILSAFLIGLIGFYNPGKVIVKTIDTVQKESPNTNVNTEQVSFTTPADNIDEHKNKTESVTDSKKSRVVPRKFRDNSTEQENRREEMIEWIADVKPEDLNEEVFPELVSYVASDSKTRDFSIPENIVHIQPDYTVDVHPYVPSTSFTYHFVEDTALPKKYVLTQADIKAKEAMTSAIKALQEIDWQKLEKEMAAEGKKIDIIKLQQKLKKAISDVDWKKINEEMQSSLIQEENDLLKDHKTLQLELKKFQQERSTKSAEQQRIYKAIISERLCEKEVQQTKPVKKKITQKKKIVYI